MTSGRGPARGWWVIFDGQTPTAFRARMRDALLPTLFQLQRKQPAVSLKWVERGRVWTSPEDARQAALAARGRPRRELGRSRDWRPGGEHRDPRQRFALTRDQKRARFKARQRRPAGPAGPIERGKRRGKGPK